ncbi:TlpA disulfide reductase family protein [candidate division KSB1 bacterium]
MIVRSVKITLFSALLILMVSFCAEEKVSPIEHVDADQVRNAVGSKSGNVVLVNMWATWCDPCVEEFPDIVDLYNRYKDSGLEVITVSFDFEEQIETKLIPFLAEQNADGFLNYFKNEDIDDNKFIDGFDPDWSGAIPVTFLYDRQGNRQMIKHGRFDRTELEKKIIELLGN